MICFIIRKESLFSCVQLTGSRALETSQLVEKIASPVGIPVSLQDIGIPLFSGGLEIIHKDLWDF